MASFYPFFHVALIHLTDDKPDVLRRQIRDSDVRILSETGEGNDAGNQRVTSRTRGVAGPSDM